MEQPWAFIPLLCELDKRVHFMGCPEDMELSSTGLVGCSSGYTGSAWVGKTSKNKIGLGSLSSWEAGR